MKIVGLRLEKYLDYSISGHNCDFEYADAIFIKSIICILLDNMDKVEIHLTRSEGQCGSGWCAASFGHIEVMRVSNFTYNYIAKKDLKFEYITDTVYSYNDEDDKITLDFSNYINFKTCILQYDTINSNIFTCTSDGGDSYYPSGGYSVNLDNFIKTDRIIEKRPVWIFKGDSNLGKSFIASNSRLQVYETDSKQILPNIIRESIIVLGNKFKFTINEIKEKIPCEFKLILVDFTMT